MKGNKISLVSVIIPLIIVSLCEVITFINPSNKYSLGIMFIFCGVIFLLIGFINLKANKRNIGVTYIILSLILFFVGAIKIFIQIR